MASTSQGDVFDDDLDEDLLAEEGAEATKEAKAKRMKKSLFDLEDEAQSSPPAKEIKREQEEGTSSSMTAAQKARAERNRLKAISLKQARLMARGTDENTSRVVVDQLTGETSERSKEKKVIDSGAGFFIEECPEDDEEPRRPGELSQPPAPILAPDRPSCLECGEGVADSFLLRTFDHSVCDGCRDTEPDGRHELITKTDAKATFLLRDADLDRSDERTGDERGRGPLRFIVRKNPHNPRWGDMKLYLRTQVEDLALAVWGSEEALERAHAEKETRKEKAKQRAFDRKIKELRMRVRGSLYKRQLASDGGSHEHEFGEEGYDGDEDEYFKTCKTCGFTQRYEKM